MPQVINSPARKGVIIDGTYTAPTLGDFWVFYQLINVPVNNIRLAGIIQVYQPISNSDVNAFFATAYVQVRSQQGMEGFQFRLVQNSIIRFIPLYNLDGVRVWISNQNTPIFNT